MNHTRLAHEIIHSLTRTDFKAQCPCCDTPISLRSAGLFYLNEFTTAARDLHGAMLESLKEQRHDLAEQRKHVSRSSQIGAKSVNLGFLFEKLAPTLPTFPFQPQDCRVLGMPVDLLIFEGLSKHGKVSRIFLGDIKSGGARLSERQKAIKTVVEKKRVEFEVYP